MNKLNALLIAIVATASMAFAQTPYEMTVVASQQNQGQAAAVYNPSIWTEASFIQNSSVTSNGNGYGNVSANTNDQTVTNGTSYSYSGFNNDATSTATGNMLTNFSSGGDAGEGICKPVSFNAYGFLSTGSAAFVAPQLR